MDIPEGVLIVGGRNVRWGNDSKDHLFRVYEGVRLGLANENNLISQRITWAILLSAGTVAAEAIVVKDLSETYSGGGVPQLATYLLHVALCLISAFAAWFSGRTRNGVNAAIHQITYLKRFYKKTTLDGINVFESVLGLPRPFGKKTTHTQGNTVARTFPKALFLTWILATAMEIIWLVLTVFSKQIPAAEIIVRLR